LAIPAILFLPSFSYSQTTATTYSYPTDTTEGLNVEVQYNSDKIIVKVADKTLEKGGKQKSLLFNRNAQPSEIFSNSLALLLETSGYRRLKDSLQKEIPPVYDQAMGVVSFNAQIQSRSFDSTLANGSNGSFSTNSLLKEMKKNFNEANLKKLSVDISCQRELEQQYYPRLIALAERKRKVDNAAWFVYRSAIVQNYKDVHSEDGDVDSTASLVISARTTPIYRRTRTESSLNPDREIASISRSTLFGDRPQDLQKFSLLLRTIQISIQSKWLLKKRFVRKMAEALESDSIGLLLEQLPDTLKADGPGKLQFATKAYLTYLKNSDIASYSYLKSFVNTFRDPGPAYGLEKTNRNVWMYSLQVKIQDGNIQQVLVTGSLDTRQKTPVNFSSSNPIPLASLRQVAELDKYYIPLQTGSPTAYTQLAQALGEKDLDKTDHYYIRLSDIFQYIPQLDERTSKTSPSDQTVRINFVEHLPYPIFYPLFEASSFKTAVNLRAYSDLTGLLGDRPNPIAAFEGKLVIRHTESPHYLFSRKKRVFDPSSPNWRPFRKRPFYMFSSLELMGHLNKFSSPYASIRLQEFDSPNRTFTNAFDFHRTAKADVSLALNLVRFNARHTPSRFEMFVFLKFFLNNVVFPRGVPDTANNNDIIAERYGYQWGFNPRYTIYESRRITAIIQAPFTMGYDVIGKDIELSYGPSTYIRQPLKSNIPTGDFVGKAPYLSFGELGPDGPRTWVYRILNPIHNALQRSVIIPSIDIQFKPALGASSRIFLRIATVTNFTRENTYLLTQLGAKFDLKSGAPNPAEKDFALKTLE